MSWTTDGDGSGNSVGLPARAKAMRKILLEVAGYSQQRAAEAVRGPHPGKAALAAADEAHAAAKRVIEWDDPHDLAGQYYHAREAVSWSYRATAQAWGNRYAEIVSDLQEELGHAKRAGR